MVIKGKEVNSNVNKIVQVSHGSVVIEQSVIIKSHYFFCFSVVLSVFVEKGH